MKFIDKIITWFKNFSFYRSKVLLFSALITGIMFDMFVKIDLEKWTFEYGNNSSSISVLIGIILTCIVFASYDFWLEKAKSKERTNKEIADLIRDNNISDSIKKDLIKILRSKK